MLVGLNSDPANPYSNVYNCKVSFLNGTVDIHDQR